MGYKLAGWKVIGYNEIDPKMASVYDRNMKTKYKFVEAIQDFVRWKEYPSELYDLDILDGSSPCSSFSMSGNRDKDWGKEKAFKEGQKKQVLDTLFFDFIELAGELKPKVVVAENVKGLLMGKAKGYVKKILEEFDKKGYKVRYYLLNSAKMGVPQKRERVFFVGIRKDLAEQVDELRFDFDEKEVCFGDVREEINEQGRWTAHDENIWQNIKYGDKSYADVLLRLKSKNSNFSAKFVYDDKVLSTILATEASKLVLFDKNRRVNSKEMTLCQSFPLDYDFGTENIRKIQNILGMSVPPIMMYRISKEIYEQWEKIFIKNQ